MVFGKRRRPSLLRGYPLTLWPWPRSTTSVAFPALDRPPPSQARLGAIGMSMRAASYERRPSPPLGSEEKIRLQRHLRLIPRKEHCFIIPKVRRRAMCGTRWIGISGRLRITRRKLWRQVVGKTQRPNLLRRNPSTLRLCPPNTTCLDLHPPPGPRTSLRWPVRESRDRLLGVDRQQMSLGLNTVRSR